MQLLVSVRSTREALAALAGGADVIDAKEPSAGALGAVSLDVFGAIHDAVSGRAIVSAAAGDVDREEVAAARARAFASAGASFVKLGFAGIADSQRVHCLIAAAVQAAAGSMPATGVRRGVIAVAYADAERVSSLPIPAVIAAAASAGAHGILIDTACKSGPGTRSLIAPTLLSTWTRVARRAGLLAAVAGKLTEDDLAYARDAGADIAGVRGAACDGGRDGEIDAARVRRLRQRILDDATHDRPGSRSLGLPVSS